MTVEVAEDVSASSMAAALYNELFWFLIGFVIIRVGLRAGLMPRLRIQLPWKRWDWGGAGTAATAEAQRRRAVSKAICANAAAGKHQAVLDTWRRESVCTPLPADALALVAETLAALKADHLAEDLVGHMQKHGGELSRPATLHSLLNALTVSGHLLKAEALAVLAGERLGLGRDTRSLEILVGGFAAADDEKKVCVLLRSLPAEVGSEAAARLHFVAVKGFLKSGAVQAAARQCEQMQRRGVPPSPRCLGDLLRIARGRNELGAVLDLLDGAVPVPAEAAAPALSDCLLREDHETASRVERLVRAHGSLTYTVFEPLLKINAKADGDHAMELLKEMQECGFFASEGLCGSLLARCAEVQNLKFAEALLEYLRSRSMMSLALYKTLMKVYACSGLFEKACDLYDDVVRDGIEPDSVMYGCLVKFAVKCSRKSLSWKLFEKANGGDVQNYMWLMRAAGRDGDVDGALSLLRKLKETQAEGVDASVYNCALDVCVSNGDTQQAEGLLTEMCAAGLHNQVTYNTLMKGHVAKGDVEAARRVLSQMARAGLTPDGVSYNCLLSAVVSAGDLQQAWCIISEMDRNRVPLDHYSVSIMMKAARRAKHTRDADRALSVLDRTSVCICEDEVLFNSALDACIHRRDTERLARVVAGFAEFGQAKLRPSVHTYGLLIKACSLLQRLPSCRELWKEMTQQRSITPTDITLSCMLDALVCGHAVDEAVTLFRKWQPIVPANTVIYATLIKGFASNGDPKRAMDIFRELREEGLPMNLVAYTTLIDAQARVGDMEKATDLLRMMEQDGCQPNLITYSSLVKGHCVRGSLREAFAALQEMLRRGIAADTVIYNTLLDGCVRHSKFDLADQLLADMNKCNVERTNFTISIVVKMWGKRRRLDEAFQVVRDSQQDRGMRLDAQVGTCLISACLLNRAIDRALQAFEDLKRWPDGTPDAGTYGALIAGLVRHGRCRKAAELAEEACGLAEGPRASLWPLSEETLDVLFKALKAEGLYEELGQAIASRISELGPSPHGAHRNARWQSRAGQVPCRPAAPGAVRSRTRGGW